MIELMVRKRHYVGYDPKRSAPTFEKEQYKGRRCVLNGEEIELFTLRVFALALDRNAKQVRRWEHLKLIPKPLFRLGSAENLTRWYSHSQVVNCHRVVMYRWKGRKYMQDAATFSAFMADIRTVFFRQDVVVNLQGQFKEDAHGHSGTTGSTQAT